MVDAFAETAWVDGLGQDPGGLAAPVRTWVTVHYAARPITSDMLAPFGIPWIGYVPDGRQGFTLEVPGTLSSLDVIRVQLYVALPPWVPASTVNDTITAYSNDETYLALANPTQAQALAQVAALTRQVERLMLRLANLDDGSL